MDPRRLGEWVTLHSELGVVPEPPLQGGATLDQTLIFGGKSFHVHWRLVEAHEPHVAVWEGEGPHGSRATVKYSVGASGKGTTNFEYSNVVYPRSGLRGWRARRLISGDLPEREVRSTLQRLKQLVEAEVAQGEQQPVGT